MRWTFTRFIKAKLTGSTLEDMAVVCPPSLLWKFSASLAAPASARGPNLCQRWQQQPLDFPIMMSSKQALSAGEQAFLEIPCPGQAVPALFLRRCTLQEQVEGGDGRAAKEDAVLGSEPRTAVPHARTGRWKLCELRNNQSN